MLVLIDLFICSFMAHGMWFEWLWCTITQFPPWGSNKDLILIILSYDYIR